MTRRFLFLMTFLLLLSTLTVAAQPEQRPAPTAPVPVELPAVTLNPTETQRYIVQLANPPVLQAGLANEGVLSREAATYREALFRQQDALLAELASEPLARYTVATNGFALTLTGAEAVALANNPAVASVRRDDDRQLLSDNAPGWIGAPAVWNGTAVSTATQGEGMIIAILDDGINNSHPSFSANGGDGYTHTNPLGGFRGHCLTTPSFCNSKLIGAYDYADGLTETNENDGPLDASGHGSHVAAIAVGNEVEAIVTAETGYQYVTSLSGVAPHANLISYDVCAGTCPGAAILAAIDQAILDGVDVINLSITGGTDPYNDPVELALLTAVEQGIFVAASAGNDGAAVSSVNHHSPWVTTVGATTHARRFSNTLLNLSSSAGDLPNINGNSRTIGYGPAPVRDAAAHGDPNCLTPLPIGTWEDGPIVVCEMDESLTNRQKAINMHQGGAAGVIFIAEANDGSTLLSDGYFLPGINISHQDGQALKSWLATGEDHVGTISGTSPNFATSNADRLASFSGRGPASLSVLKPDLVAPGVAILSAANSANPSDPPTYGLQNGTSMSSPMVAGAAVLLADLHPDWTPDEIRAALMLTAETAVLTHHGTDATPLGQGAGRIDISRAAQAGLVLDESVADYENANPTFDGDPRTLNLPSVTDNACFLTCTHSRTLRSTLTQAATWTATVETADNISVTVQPSSFTVAAGASRAVEITADLTNHSANDGYAFATLRLTSPGQQTLRLPIVLQKATSDSEALSVTAPATAEPGDIITYRISLDNLDSVSNSFALTNTLPAGVEYIPNSATGGLTYSAATRRLTWQGNIGPGTEGYEITAVSHIPYRNLGTIGGIVNNCDRDGVDCDRGAVSVDLDAQYNSSVSFYDETLTNLNLSANGYIHGSAPSPSCPDCPQPLPTPQLPNSVMAGLWRDIDMSNGNGQWYHAVVNNLLTNPADQVLYVNWHNAGQFGASLATSRHAIAVVLDGQSEPAGRIYYIYDQINGRNIIEQQGFSIGTEDASGTEGTQVAFAPCTGTGCVSNPTVGALPNDQTTLRLDPTIVGGSSAKTFTFQVRVTGDAETLLTNRVEVISDGPAAEQTAVADTRIAIRRYLPLIAQD